jgi:putative SOS response-associated peptidase YedK
MCATYQLSFDDLKEIRSIADQITKKYGKEESARCFSKDFFPKSLAPVIGPEDKVSLLKWRFPMRNSSQVVFNARADKLEISPMYRASLNNRCLVPITSFYEWDKEKKKYRISLENQRLFYLAGLWKEYLIDGNKSFFYTIITTEPNEQIGQIHNRMPAIISGEDANSWIAGNTRSMLSLLKPFDAHVCIESA